MKLQEKVQTLFATIEEAEKQENAEHSVRGLLPRLQKYENAQNILGKRNSYSKTDTDATFMRMKEDHMRNGQLKPGYNACRSGSRISSS